MHYEVSIQATVRKAYVVAADSEGEACEIAHEIFTVGGDDGVADLKYEQETLDVRSQHRKNG